MENSRFNIKRYAEPKTEEDRKTLANFGYRTLSLAEALEYVETIGQLIAGDVKVGVLPDHIKDGSVELRYYTKEGAAALKEEENIFVFIKEVDRAIPIGIQKPGTKLRSEKI